MNKQKNMRLFHMGCGESLKARKYAHTGLVMDYLTEAKQKPQVGLVPERQKTEGKKDDSSS